MYSKLKEVYHKFHNSDSIMNVSCYKFSKLHSIKILNKLTDVILGYLQKG